jgi:uncharacterized membrane protein
MPEKLLIYRPDESIALPEGAVGTISTRGGEVYVDASIANDVKQGVYSLYANHDDVVALAVIDAVTFNNNQPAIAGQVGI